MWCGLPTDFAFTPLPFWPLPGLLLQYAVHVTYIHTRHTDGTHAYLVYIGAGQPTAFVHVAYTLAGVLAGGGSGSVGGGGFDTLSFVGGSWRTPFSARPSFGPYNVARLGLVISGFRNRNAKYTARGRRRGVAFGIRVVLVATNA